MLKKLHLYRGDQSYSGLSVIVTVVLIAAVGTYLLSSSHAATPFASVDAINGSLANGATSQSCSGSSDGNCVVFEGNVVDNLLNQEKQIVAKAVNGYTYQNGEWLPSVYSTSSWAVYQEAAAGAATIGVTSGGTVAERQMAIDTINTAIKVHQLSSGDFDDGTPSSGTSGDNGTMWVEAEGYSALALRNYVPIATEQSWEQSMVKYTNFLETGDTKWYANGNVNMSYAVALLETYDLAKFVGDSNASTYWNDYVFEKAFLTNPDQATGDMACNSTSVEKTRWGGGYGQQATSDGGYYFREAAGGGACAASVCANGIVPCNGFDPEYTMLQMNNASVGLSVGGDNSFFQGVLENEYRAEDPLIGTNGVINAGNGSRKDHPDDTFDAQVYYYLQSANQGNYTTAWSTQLSLLNNDISGTIGQTAPWNGAYRYLLFMSDPLISTTGSAEQSTTN
jgi:hypothetical protein